MSSWFTSLGPRHAVFDWLPTLDAGSWPSWVSAIGTTAAFLVAAFTYLRTSSQRKAAQARLVYAEVSTDSGPLPKGAAVEFHGPGAYTPDILKKDAEGKLTLKVAGLRIGLRVVNKSDEMISHVMLSAFDLETGKSRLENSSRIFTLPPQSEVTWMTVVKADESFGYRIGARVVYCDADGRWWQRLDGHPIRRAPKELRTADPSARPPRSIYKTPGGLSGIWTPENVFTQIRYFIPRTIRRIRYRHPH